MGAHVSKAQLVRVMAAASDQGAPIKAFRVCANGDVLLLTEQPEGALPAIENDNDWVALAGEAEISRAQGT